MIAVNNEPYAKKKSVSQSVHQRKRVTVRSESDPVARIYLLEYVCGDEKGLLLAFFSSLRMV